MSETEILLRWIDRLNPIVEECERDIAAYTTDADLSRHLKLMRTHLIVARGIAKIDVGHRFRESHGRNDTKGAA